MSAATSEMALSLSGVGKRYGRIQALDGLDLQVPRGSIFGLVGPNGAGKTTTFAIACGFLRADRGSVSLLGGGRFEPRRHRGRVTALPQDAALGRDLTLVDQLTYLGRLQGIGRKAIRGEVERILQLVDLTGRAGTRTKTLSHGMLRRLGIGQAFLGNPELVLLDEPTNGLDPRQAHDIRGFIAAQRGQRTIVISSHNLHEIETICDRVALMNGGRVVVSGPIAEVTGRDDEILITVAEGPLPLAEVAQALAGDTVDWDAGARVLKIRYEVKPERHGEDVIGAALRVLLAAGARISAVSRGQSLERKYLEMPGGGE
ncbi:MAG: ABC transporter ATP-binding protein, partial [Opitutales bacterium]